MAHALEMNVVLEGVEETAQWEILRELGCDELRGYLLGRHVTAKDATELLSQGANLKPKLRLLHGSSGKQTGEKRNVAIRGVLNDATIQDAALAMRAGNAG